MTQSTTGQQLTQLTTQTTSLTNAIRNRITVLNDANRKSPQNDPGFNTRKLQIANLQNSFKRALEEYNLVEKRSREKYRDRMARQIKIGVSLGWFGGWADADRHPPPPRQSSPTRPTTRSRRHGTTRRVALRSFPKRCVFPFPPPLRSPGADPARLCLARLLADAGRPRRVRRGPIPQPGPAQDRRDDHAARADDAGCAFMLFPVAGWGAAHLARTGRWRPSCWSRTSRSR